MLAPTRVVVIALLHSWIVLSRRIAPLSSRRTGNELGRRSLAHPTSAGLLPKSTSNRADTLLTAAAAAPAHKTKSAVLAKSSRTEEFDGLVESSRNEKSLLQSGSRSKLHSDRMLSTSNASADQTAKKSIKLITLGRMNHSARASVSYQNFSNRSAISGVLQQILNPSRILAYINRSRSSGIGKPESTPWLMYGAIFLCIGCVLNPIFIYYCCRTKRNKKYRRQRSEDRESSSRFLSSNKDRRFASSVTEVIEKGQERRRGETGKYKFGDFTRGVISSVTTKWQDQGRGVSRAMTFG